MSAAASPQPYLFLSYSHDNTTRKDELLANLNVLGAIHKFEIWTDKNALNNGHRYTTDIAKGIRESALFLCLISSSYVKSDSCLREFLLASKHKKKIIPIMLERIDLESIDEFAYTAVCVQRCPLYKNMNRNNIWSGAYYDKLVEDILSSLKCNFIQVI